MVGLLIGPCCVSACDVAVLAAHQDTISSLGRGLTSGWMKGQRDCWSCDTVFLRFAAIASSSPALFLVLL